VLRGLKVPSAGQAVVGQGVARVLSGNRLHLGSRNPITVEVIDTFPADTSLATHDLVWTSPGDARQLLGLAPGQASDLAVHLFRQEEEQAILADLAAFFPGPCASPAAAAVRCAITPGPFVPEVSPWWPASRLCWRFY
jgi:hypothetical protein